MRRATLNQSGRIRICALLSLALLTLVGVQAQGPSFAPGTTKPSGSLRPETAVPESSNGAQLKIPVWVEDHEGNFWQDAKRQSFHVFLEDREVPVKGMLNAQNGTVLLVVFDTVADLARLEEARTALQENLKDLGDKFWTGLLTAQDGLAVIQEPTPDAKLLTEKIQAIQISARAGLLDTLEPVSQLATALMQKAAVRVIVLYLTDSGVANYRADYLNPVINSSDAGDLSRRFSDRAIQERISRLSESLSKYTIPIFTLHLLQRGDSLNLAYQSGIERISADSGGEAIICRTNDEIGPGLEKMIHRIKSGYLLAVDIPKTKRQSMKVRVTVIPDDDTMVERVITIPQAAIRKK